ncbi:MAG: efflux RND transporter periplasmic adaptor subunit [Acidobacteriota bacterium]
MRLVRVLLILAAIAAAFFAGRLFKPKQAPPQTGERKVLYWVDPMHPAYKSDKPGIAPDCGMKLEPVYAEPAPGAPAGPAAPAPEMPPGTVQISADRQQLIGVRYGTAEYSAGTDVIRAAGKVAIDETRVAHVHSRTEGWVEKVFANFTGDFVKKGQPMLTIYSPELLATQQEFLLALKARDVMHHATVQGASADTNSLVEAARRRLQLWDLSDAQIDEVARTGKPLTSVTLYAPSSGYITARNAFANQKAMPDVELYTLVDLSRVWVQASVFEYQVPSIRLGQMATVELPYNGGKTYHARVTFIQPQVDPATRTVQVRLELPNPRLALKPEMFVNVELSSPQPRRLTVPAEAVLDSGLRKTVFLDRGNGYFEPREVQTGERIGDRIVILGGLVAGDRIVTSGNFLLNSESQLKAAAAGSAAVPPAGPGAGAPATPGEHHHD